ncbi:MAG TPA: alkaline phosphatase D family protein [Geminicoccaceae bacterium]|nr:alkaline phosphatase D family protein [Geminicoccaceae bacterium]
MTTLPIAPLGWLALAFLSLVQIGVAAAADEGAMLELGPMLGATSAHATRIWVKASRAAESTAIVGEHADLRDAVAIDGPKLTGESDHMGILEVSGLRPSTRYFYRVLIDGDAASPVSSFVTAPPDGTAVRLRFATTSCVGLPEDAERSWEELAKAPIDLLLRLGDNVYAGSTDPDVQRRIYYAQRRIPAHRSVVRRTPSLAIWDDWDYAGDNSDGTAPGKESSLRTFKQLWPNPGFGQASDPGVYFKHTWGDIDFFMLDGRYRRSPNEAPDDGRKTMLGSAQLAWLKRELAASTATFKFLASGGEWQSRGRVDSWRSFRRERDELFRFIRDHRITGVVLLSGDRHVTAGYQVLGRFLEITSGPFGAGNHEPPYNPDEMFLLHDQGDFFVVLEVDTTGTAPSLTLEVHEVGRGLVRRRPFSWQEINGEVAVPTCDLLPECRE